MASTRNINTPGDYRQTQAALEARRAHVAYAGARVCDTVCLPGNGLLAGRMGHAQLAHNGADIEAFLFGIGASNLVAPPPRLEPQMRALKSLSIISRGEVVLPEPLVVRPLQRPRPLA